MNEKNKAIVFYGNINMVCDYLKKCSEDFIYMKDLIDYYNCQQSELS
jgi:hypothetical protein